MVLSEQKLSQLFTEMFASCDKYILDCLVNVQGDSKYSNYIMAVIKALSKYNNIAKGSWDTDSGLRPVNKPQKKCT